jgi:hypothetical protein
MSTQTAGVGWVFARTRSFPWMTWASQRGRWGSKPYNCFLYTDPIWSLKGQSDQSANSARCEVPLVQKNCIAASSHVHSATICNPFQPLFVCETYCCREGIGPKCWTSAELLPWSEWKGLLDLQHIMGLVAQITASKLYHGNSGLTAHIISYSPYSTSQDLVEWK